MSNSWNKKSLGQLIELEYGASLRDDARTGDGLPVYGSNGVVGHHAKSLVDGPGIVVGRKGSVGKVIWSDSDFWPIDTAYFVNTKGNSNLKWMYYLLGSLRLSRLDSSTGVPGLNRNDVYQLAIQEPPEPEQFKIAEVLSTCDEAIEQTEVIIAKYERIKCGLMQDLLTKGIDENGYIRSEKTHKFKNSSLGRVPVEWDVKPLISVATLQRGIDLPIQRRIQGDIPIYGSNGIDGWHTETPVKGPGVITGRSGSIGFVYYSESDYWPLNTTLYVRDFHDNYPQYVWRLLTSLRLSRFAAATGVPSLNRNFVHPHPVLVPNIEEQKLIACSLNQIDDVLKNEQSHRDKLLATKHGLMQDLLSGKVRVTPLMQKV